MRFQGFAKVPMPRRDCGACFPFRKVCTLARQPAVLALACFFH